MLFTEQNSYFFDRTFNMNISYNKNLITNSRLTLSKEESIRERLIGEVLFKNKKLQSQQQLLQEES